MPNAIRFTDTHKLAATKIMLADALSQIKELEANAKQFESSIKAQIGECFDGIEDGPVLEMIRSTGRLFASAMAEQARFDKRVAALEVEL